MASNKKRAAGGGGCTEGRSIVEKLDILRSLGVPVVESDLARCLSQSGWNVEIAAERLITGQFRPSKKPNKKINSDLNINTKASTSSSPSSSSPSSLSPTSGSFGSNKTPRQATTRKKSDHRNVTPSSTGSFRKAESNISQPSPKLPKTTSTSNRNCNVTTDRMGKEGNIDNSWWLLCQRWVSDGVNLKRDANCEYQEELHVLVETSSASPNNGSRNDNSNSNRYQQNKTNKNNDNSLRFRSGTRRIEGSFPRYLSLILGPLLRNRLVIIKATTLMEERRLNIGSQVAFSLSVWIDPIEFFAIFDDDNNNNNNNNNSNNNNNDGKTTSTSERDSSKAIGASYSKQFVASAAYSGDIGASKNRRGLNNNDCNNNNCREAAFLLLQWAQHGKPEVQNDNNANKQAVLGSGLGDDDDDDDDDDENEEDVDMTKSLVHKSALDELAAIPDWAQGVLSTERNETTGITNDNDDDENTMDTPSGFKDGVQLRPYQKQALYWMTQREKKVGSGRSELIQLLKELAGVTKPIGGGDDDEVTVLDTQKTICCDCGPVQVDTNRVEAPSVAAFANNMSTSLTAHHHPLWEQRFLCNDQQKKALSFFVQPCFRNAAAVPPPPPAPARGGILADSMGLGKTVQLLSMMQAEKEDEDENETSYYGTLVVAPLSLLHQWEQEIETKTHLTHRIHYNDGKKKLCVSHDNIDVVLTTYGTLQAEFRTQQKQNETTGKLLSKMWKRVILDECHIIKNHQTLVAKACCSVRAERRWCVSGTIIQNSLQDLYSLLRFLRHEPFSEKAFWNNTITKVDFSVALDRVKEIICPIMIRRTKETLDRNGKPILILPEIDYKSVTVEFSPEERQFYEALYRKSFDIFKGFIQAGKASSSWLKIFSLLHRLRQSCSHVALTVKSHLDDEEWTSNIENEAPTKKRTNQDQEKDKDSIDSSFLEDLHQKFKSMQSRSNTVNDDSNNEYVSSVAQMLNNAIQNESSELNEECPICLDVIDVATEPVLTPCLHMFCKGCLLDYTKNERQKKLSNTKTVNPICVNSGNCPVCSKEIDDRKILRMKYSSSGKIQTSFLHQQYQEISPEDSSHNEEDVDARKTLQTAIKGSSSSKLAAIHKELQIIWEKEPGSKVLIFSQFLGFLDIIQKSFKTNNIRYSRLDGSLSLKDRMKVLRDFGCESPGSTSSLNSNAGSVLLISMKAGGVGLNLVAARSVFIVDPWWNSAVEDQCVDRIHRIGQTAEKIYVRKFFVSNSIEERILELQKRKKNIASAILCDKGTAGADGIGARPSLEDFRILFGDLT